MLAQVLSTMLLLPGVLSIPASTTDFQPWLKRNAPRIEVTSSRALRECSKDTISWELKGLDVYPRDRIEWTVVPLVTSPGGAQLAAESSHLWDVRGSTEQSWVVDYPEGTSVVYYISTWLKRDGAKDLYIEGRSANYSVKAGKRRDCIPESHYPIVVDLGPLQDLSECSTADLSWSGGVAPYSLYIDAENSDSQQQVFLGSTSKNQAEWKVDFPFRSRPRLTITDRNGWSGSITSHVLNITSTGQNTSCVPRSHLFSRPWYTSVNGVITLSMLGGVFVMCTILFCSILVVDRRRRTQLGQREKERLLSGAY